VIIYKNIKQEFLPPQDQSRLFMIMKTKPGSSLEFTDNKIKEIEKIMLTQPEIQRYFVAVGGFGGDEANSAVSYITLRSIKDRPINTELGRKLTQQEFSSYLRDKLRAVEGVFVIIQDPSLSGFSAGRSYPIEFSLTGPDWDKLIELSQLAQDIMKESGMVSDIDTNYRGRVPELRILPDRDKALKRGVSVDDIGRTIQSMVSGIVAGKFAKGGRRYDIRVKIKDSELTDISDISKIMVRNNRGELVSLSEVTKIEEQEGLLSITRDNRARAVALFANLAPGASQAEALDLIAEKVGPKLPKDYLLIQSGAAQTFQESSSSLIFVLVLGIIIAYMILASQFNSFIHPITILSALPFSLVGAMLALWLFSKTLNIYSMIGVILLMGIVKKNSIILVDFTNQMKEQGLSTIEALLKACPIRLRPIVMTSVSTMAGTLPAALAMGPGSETRIPMALAVIGGVLVSTFLTLYVVPCLYSLFSRKS
jgi:HAE1 family hydrophobic/amphiphilic exporter-1